MFSYFHCLIMLIVTINYLLTYLLRNSTSQFPTVMAALRYGPAEQYGQYTIRLICMDRTPVAIDTGVLHNPSSLPSTNSYAGATPAPKPLDAVSASSSASSISDSDEVLQYLFKLVEKGQTGKADLMKYAKSTRRSTTQSSGEDPHKAELGA